MNRTEALKVLGLKEGATKAEIKTAYKEMAQILHPDKQGDNEKLRARAEEQFKQVNEAKDVLLNGNSHSPRGRGGNTRASYEESERWEPTQANGSWSTQLEQIAVARAQQVAMQDSLVERRNLGILLAAGGTIAAFLIRINIPQAIAVCVAATGLIQLISAFDQLGKVNRRLEELDRMRASIEAQM